MLEHILNFFKDAYTHTHIVEYTPFKEIHVDMKSNHNHNICIIP